LELETALLMPSERDKLIREAAARAYRAELRRLAEWGVPGPDEEDEA
jgi:hypothetical protein